MPRHQTGASPSSPSSSSSSSSSSPPSSLSASQPSPPRPPSSIGSVSTSTSIRVHNAQHQIPTVSSLLMLLMLTMITMVLLTTQAVQGQTLPSLQTSFSDAAVSSGLQSRALSTFDNDASERSSISQQVSNSLTANKLLSETTAFDSRTTHSDLVSVFTESQTPLPAQESPLFNVVSVTSSTNGIESRMVSTLSDESQVDVDHTAVPSERETAQRSTSVIETLTKNSLQLQENEQATVTFGPFSGSAVSDMVTALPVSTITSFTESLHNTVSPLRSNSIAEFSNEDTYPSSLPLPVSSQNQIRSISHTLLSANPDQDFSENSEIISTFSMSNSDDLRADKSTPQSSPQLNTISEDSVPQLTEQFSVMTATFSQNPKNTVTVQSATVETDAAKSESSSVTFSQLSVIPEESSETDKSTAVAFSDSEHSFIVTSNSESRQKRSSSTEQNGSLEEQTSPLVQVPFTSGLGMGDSRTSSAFAFIEPTPAGPGYISTTSALSSVMILTDTTAFSSASFSFSSSPVLNTLSNPQSITASLAPTPTERKDTVHSSSEERISPEDSSTMKVGFIVDASTSHNFATPSDILSNSFTSMNAHGMEELMTLTPSFNLEVSTITESIFHSLSLDESVEMNGFLSKLQISGSLGEASPKTQILVPSIEISDTTFPKSSSGFTDEDSILSFSSNINDFTFVQSLLPVSNEPFKHSINFSLNTKSVVTYSQSGSLNAIKTILDSLTSSETRTSTAYTGAVFSYLSDNGKSTDEVLVPSSTMEQMLTLVASSSTYSEEVFSSSYGDFRDGLVTPNMNYSSISIPPESLGSTYTSTSTEISSLFSREITRSAQFQSFTSLPESRFSALQDNDTVLSGISQSFHSVMPSMTNIENMDIATSETSQSLQSLMPSFTGIDKMDITTSEISQSLQSVEPSLPNIDNMDMTTSEISQSLQSLMPSFTGIDKMDITTSEISQSLQSVEPSLTNIDNMDMTTSETSRSLQALMPSSTNIDKTDITTSEISQILLSVVPSLTDIENVDIATSEISQSLKALMPSSSNIDNMDTATSEISQILQPLMTSLTMSENTVITAPAIFHSIHSLMPSFTSFTSIQNLASMSVQTVESGELLNSLSESQEATSLKDISQTEFFFLSDSLYSTSIVSSYDTKDMSHFKTFEGESVFTASILIESNTHQTLMNSFLDASSDSYKIDNMTLKSLIQPTVLLPSSEDIEIGSSLFGRSTLMPLSTAVKQLSSSTHQQLEPFSADNNTISQPSLYELSTSSLVMLPTQEYQTLTPSLNGLSSLSQIIENSTDEEDTAIFPSASSVAASLMTNNVMFLSDPYESIALSGALETSSVDIANINYTLSVPLADIFSSFHSPSIVITEILETLNNGPNTLSISDTSFVTHAPTLSGLATISSYSPLSLNSIYDSSNVINESNNLSSIIQFDSRYPSASPDLETSVIESSIPSHLEQVTSVHASASFIMQTLAPSEQSSITMEMFSLEVNEGSMFSSLSSYLEETEFLNSSDVILSTALTDIDTNETETVIMSSTLLSDIFQSTESVYSTFLGAEAMSTVQNTILETTDTFFTTDFERSVTNSSTSFEDMSDPTLDTLLFPSESMSLTDAFTESYMAMTASMSDIFLSPLEPTATESQELFQSTTDMFSTDSSYINSIPLLISQETSIEFTSTVVNGATSLLDRPTDLFPSSPTFAFNMSRVESISGEPVTQLQDLVSSSNFPFTSQVCLLNVNLHFQINLSSNLPL
ncbi:hypothetical protein PoB_006609700 [Plakobranchus ocellatus]|uniref:SEA domain-containing protein n=1 Tax=Plakobranchus ocellatus TaxID=259542 RepID=A0AAV4D654_9GAST|nr:hypothetical protein PoB_006609700 [Plakobranchus ocellatus]